MVSRLVDVGLYVDTMEGGAFDFIVPPLSANELTHVVKCAVENVLNLRRGAGRSQLTGVTNSSP